MHAARLLAAVAIAAGSPHYAAAQDYPAKPVKIVVSFTAGGTTDVIARKIAERLAHYWKQSVVVENKPGAGGTLGTDLVVAQPADGYTLLMSSSGPMVISPSLPKKLATDPLTALVPVILVADVANVLVTSPEMRSRSLEELVREAKANPGKLNYASTGVGTVAHLAARSSPSARASTPRMSPTRAPKP
jgi:tripartite-type tricarboxylate transporter receptor subunit TctC